MTPRTVRAPRGSQITCLGWQQEAAMRMLMNNLDPDVAELPEQLIVYGGSGKAARNWECFDAIVATLQRLKSDETLLVQSGKPVVVFRTTPDAPRVLIANSNLVPRWGNWDEFRRLEALGLTMFGQMTAGSWIYIGTQGIVQGTFETFAEAARQHFSTNTAKDDGTLEGRWVLTAGLGGMGGAQPLAVTMNGGACLVAEVDAHRIQRRLETGYLDRVASSVEDGIAQVLAAAEARQAVSIAVEANAAEVFARIAGDPGLLPDMVTDQTSAHDMLNGYVPDGLPYADALRLRASDSAEYLRRAKATVARHVQAMLTLRERGSHVFDYGNNIRGEARDAGIANAFDFPGFVPAYIRPLFCRGKGPFRWAALSGDPADIARTDRALLDTFPDDPVLKRWLPLAAERVHYQGLPARICWLGYRERDRAGEVFNQLVARGEVKAPIVIGRDHLDAGSVASPFRETEAMRDGSDAIADWPILNALVSTASGATWVSLHHGGGVGIGNSLHAGLVVVADGTPDASARLSRVLTNDPGMGVARHADAGYEEAIRCARETGLDIPMVTPR